MKYIIIKLIIFLKFFNIDIEINKNLYFGTEVEKRFEPSDTVRARARLRDQIKLPHRLASRKHAPPPPFGERGKERMAAMRTALTGLCRRGFGNSGYSTAAAMGGRAAAPRAALLPSLRPAALRNLEVRRRH